MLEEALEHLVKGIVDHDGDVAVRTKSARHGDILEVRVHPDDLGRVIGRRGRTASALRTVPDEVMKEFHAHGVSVIEVRKNRSTYSYKRDSAYNRRITTLTDIFGFFAFLGLATVFAAYLVGV